MEWSIVVLLPEVHFESEPSPVHCPLNGAEGLLCVGAPLLKKLRAATRGENPRAQSRPGLGWWTLAIRKGFPRRWVKSCNSDQLACHCLC